MASLQPTQRGIELRKDAARVAPMAGRYLASQVKSPLPPHTRDASVWHSTWTTSTSSVRRNAIEEQHVDFPLLLTDTTHALSVYFFLPSGTSSLQSYSQSARFFLQLLLNAVASLIRNQHCSAGMAILLEHGHNIFLTVLVLISSFSRSLILC